LNILIQNNNKIFIKGKKNMTLEIEYLKNLILKYFYNSNEIINKKNKIINTIKIDIDKNNKFIYYINIEEIFKDIYLLSEEEKERNFNEMIYYLNKNIKCYLFIFIRNLK
jgi:hypothetical protein